MLFCRLPSRPEMTMARVRARAIDPQGVKIEFSQRQYTPPVHANKRRKMRSKACHLLQAIPWITAVFLGLPVWSGQILQPLTLPSWVALD
jgi:hypothetical protein